jgi:hypothetical protein
MLFVCIPDHRKPVFRVQLFYVKLNKFQSDHLRFFVSHLDVLLKLRSCKLALRVKHVEYVVVIGHLL